MVIAEVTIEEKDMLSTVELQFATLEQKLIEWGLPYTVNLEFLIDDIEFSPAAQVRAAANLAPKERVEEYRMQMQSGAKFPPILLRSPGNIMIDGNTRVAAAKRVGRQTIPAILVDTKTEAMHLMLAASVNQMGGERLTGPDAHAAALLMLQGGFPDSSIAREMGRDQSQVRKWRTQQEVLTRATSMNVDLDGVTVAVIERLADIRLDQPFVEAAQLFSEIRPKSNEAKEIVTAIATASTEEAAVQVVKDLRDEYAVAGPPPKARNRESGLAHAAIGNLVKFEGRPSAAFNPAQREEELVRWQKLSSIVASVLEALNSYDPKMIND
mgnify:CR=1 FL=1|tara:strand:+ start:182 stop:1159 length:978 start_codon:yes stop_codon:yes gene_type:complete